MKAEAKCSHGNFVVFRLKHPILWHFEKCCLSIVNVFYKPHVFSVFSTIQKIVLPVPKLWGYTIALITAHATGMHMWLVRAPDPIPTSETVVWCSCLYQNAVSARSPFANSRENRLYRKRPCKYTDRLRECKMAKWLQRVSVPCGNRIHVARVTFSLKPQVRIHYPPKLHINNHILQCQINFLCVWLSYSDCSSGVSRSDKMHRNCG